MKKFTILITIVAILGGTLTSAQAPTKLFDVRNGNGIVDNGVTQAQATYIVYKDQPAKQKVLDAFVSAYGYQATVPNPAFDSSKPVDAQTNPQTIPNPQSKQAFFNRQLTAYIRDIVRSEAIKTAAKTASDSAATTADSDLPPQ